MANDKAIISVFHPKTHLYIGYVLTDENGVCTVDCAHGLHTADLILLTETYEDIFIDDKHIIVCLLDKSFLLPTHYYKAKLSRVAIPRKLDAVTRIATVVGEADNLEVVKVVGKLYNKG